MSEEKDSNLKTAQPMAVENKPAPVVVTSNVKVEPAKPEPSKPIQFTSMRQPNADDEYHGVGGVYELDPVTGKRRPLKELLPSGM